MALDFKAALSGKKPISINSVGEYVLAFNARTAPCAFTANTYGADGKPNARHKRIGTFTPLGQVFGFRSKLRSGFKCLSVRVTGYELGVSNYWLGARGGGGPVYELCARKKAQWGDLPHKIRSRGDIQPGPCSLRFGYTHRWLRQLKKNNFYNMDGEYVLAFNARTASGIRGQQVWYRRKPKMIQGIKNGI